jgi:hypothetical protein
MKESMDYRRPLVGDLSRAQGGRPIAPMGPQTGYFALEVLTEIGYTRQRGYRTRGIAR